MAQTNAEKQELYRARQRQAMTDQTTVIAGQQKTIADLQAQLTKATAQVQKLTEDKHVLEIKLIKLQSKKT